MGYYRAKSIKANLYQIQRERLQLEFDTLPADAPAVNAPPIRPSWTTTALPRSKYDAEKKTSSAPPTSWKPSVTTPSVMVSQWGWR